MRDTGHVLEAPGQAPDPAVLEAEVRGVHERFSRSLFAFAKVISGDADSAEEALQEAYHRYLATRSKGVLILNPQAWLLRVIHHLIIDWRKAQARTVELKSDVPAPAAPDPSQQAESLAQLIGRARRVLTPREREVLDLRLKGLRYVDVAEALGIGEGSVSTHLRRAFRKLRSARWRDEG